MMETCAGGCTGGFCAGDPCAGVTCNASPGVCHATPGVCSGGTCSYAVTTGQDCDDDDACTSGDTCLASGTCRGTLACTADVILINEVRLGPVADAFVELWTAPGTSLAGYTLVRLGDNGTDAESLNLAGTVGSSGLFVVADPTAAGAVASAADQRHVMVAAALSNTSFQVRRGNAVLDAVALGTFVAPQVSAGEGRPVAAPATGNSVARDGQQTDTGDNLADFTERTTGQVTPGAPNPGGNQPPTAVLTCPVGLVAGQQGTLDASASTDVDGTLVQFAFDPGDGSTPATQAGATRGHTWTTAGTYTARVVVEDNAGATAQASCTVTVAPPANQLPSAVLACPTTATVNTPVTLDGSGSADADGTLVRFAFTPGDGSAPVAGTASSVMHTYTAAGTVTAQLEVEDNLGATATATCVITVQTGACVPENDAAFCARVARNCGRVTANDNCGTARSVPDCGQCTWPQTCGGGTTEGLCAAGCGYTCPQGFSCMGADGCGGGDYAQVRLDVVTHTVAGSITLNGAQPTTTCSGSTTIKASITFESTRTGAVITQDVTCSSGTFNYSVALPQDIYRVTVRGVHATTPLDRTNLPSTPFIARAELPVNTDLAGVVLAVRSGSIAGTVRVNGAAATNPSAGCTGSTPKASVTLVGATHGASYAASLLCSSTLFSYSISNVLADTYRVVVTGLLPTSAASNVPLAAYTADTARLIDSVLTGQVLDVLTVTITGSTGTTGSIRINGASAVNTVANCSGTVNPAVVKARAVLKGITHSKDYAWDMVCSSTLFTVPATSILAGAYRLEVEGMADGSNVPYSNVPVGRATTLASRTFTADTTAVRWEMNTFTLTARTRINGTTIFPANAGACTGTGTATKARIRILGANSQLDRTRDIPCSSTTWLADFGAVPADTYRMEAMGAGGLSTLPNEPFVAQAAYALAANAANLNLVVRTAQVGGRVYLNGAVPSSGPGTCSGATPRVALTLTGTLHGAQYAFTVPCSSSAYALPAQTVLQDTYRVTTAGLAQAGVLLSSLPVHPFVAHDALVVNADATMLQFDVVTRTLEGPVLLNGANPTTMCTNPDNKAEVRLSGTRHGQVEVDTIRCGESFRAQFTVYPDTYGVDVRALGTGRTDLPDTWVPVTRLRVP